MKRVGVITGTRAEYGLLKPVMDLINRDGDLELCIIVTGMHLAEQFGYTYKNIENDGFHISYKVDMELKDDTSYGLTKSMGIELMKFADVYENAKLDMVIVLGDRYEIQIAAIGAMMYCIPIAHIHGGEITEGLIDEAVRHSVTKMSQIHFASTQEYKNRIIQMGEQPHRVYCVGALGTENIKKLNLLTREELCEKYSDIFKKEYMMITYHPVTLEKDSVEWQFENLLSIISKYKEYNYIFTFANSDTNGLIINEMIQKYVAENNNSIAYVSMGQIGYLSALKYCVAVVGNSSSALIEAPSFNIPTINIGNRQKGRVKAETVIDCGYSTEEIELAFKQAVEQEFKAYCMKCSNPYEGINTATTIVREIKNYVYSDDLDIKKKFYDIERL